MYCHSTEEITTKKGNADEEDVLVFADGTVMWAPTVYYKVLCQLNLRYWPYDQQICNFGLTSDMNVHLAFFNNSKGIALNGSVHFHSLDQVHSLDEAFFTIGAQSDGEKSALECHRDQRSHRESAREPLGSRVHLARTFLHLLPQEEFAIFPAHRHRPCPQYTFHPIF